jgi:hypothetical protein
MQKAPRAVTGDFDHATVGEEGSLHGKDFPILPWNLGHPPVSLKAWKRSRIFHAGSKQKHELNHPALGIIQRYM